MQRYFELRPFHVSLSEGSCTPRKRYAETKRNVSYVVNFPIHIQIPSQELSVSSSIFLNRHTNKLLQNSLNESIRTGPVLRVIIKLLYKFLQ